MNKGKRTQKQSLKQKQKEQEPTKSNNATKV